MTGRDHELFRLNDSWPRIGWWSVTGLVVTAVVLGFLVLGREQQNGPTLNVWNAICHALGITSDTGPASEPQPSLRTPTRIAWTSATLTQIASGDRQHGEFVALNCAACHGEHGISGSGFFPTLAGMDAATIYKQLDDFRIGKRSWGVMNAIAEALTPQDSADVATYFAGREDGLPANLGASIQSGHTLRESDAAVRLVFAGDPARGIAPCSACHGPGGHSPGAPQLQRQQAAYIERQLAAFAQGLRRNDINEQMRTVAVQLTPGEVHVIAAFYGNSAVPQMGGR